MKKLKTLQHRSTFRSCDVEKVHAVVARGTFRSQNVQNTRGSDHFWTFRCRFAWQAQGIVHHVKSELNVRVLFPRASERRVLPIVGVCISSSHLHTFSSSHLLSHHTFCHTFSSSHLLIFTPSHLHICSSSHLLIFTSSHLHIFSSSHLLIFRFSLTSAHLHI